MIPKKIITVLLFLQFSIPLFAQPNMDDVEIIPHRLTDNLYYLEGQGGNIGVSIGEDGVFLVDDQFAPLSRKILDAIAELTDQPVRFVFNTHIHGDHVGGNLNMAQQGAVIIAHENVREGLSSGFTNPNMLTDEQRLSLPVVTFPETMDFHLNGDDIHVFHIGPGHTDGDAFVYFRNANIIHTGDVFRTVAYPRVDAGNNGSFHGIMAAYQKLLDISNAETRFLPGHGVVSTRADVEEQLGIFVTIRNRVRSAIASGMSLSQIQASNFTAEYDDRWSDGDAFVAVVYSELLRM
jgi:glyoxylase-like metal-dependent hydrolase (beta-lactamase superfamily II)